MSHSAEQLGFYRKKSLRAGMFPILSICSKVLFTSLEMHYIFVVGDVLFAACEQRIGMEDYEINIDVVLDSLQVFDIGISNFHEYWTFSALVLCVDAQSKFDFLVYANYSYCLQVCANRTEL
ncbi:hypothetical protein SUGI_0456110 [Cryptomeria japonica]|nr:hypothetical protein SUGI_0456110 [Cryptomeria japonica]